MSRKRRKLYQNVVTGKMKYFTPLLVQNLPKLEHQGKMYPNGGWIEAMGGKGVNVPEAAAKEFAFGEKEAAVIRDRFEEGDLKGVTIKMMEGFAAFEGIETTGRPTRSEWVKLLSDHILGDENEGDE